MSKSEHSYDEAFVIHDKKDREPEAIRAIEKMLLEPYSTFSSNCAQSVQKGLEAVKIKTGTPTPFDRYSGWAKMMIPDIMYNSIKEQNINKENRIIKK